MTFKSRLSLPPYRIENGCKESVVWFAQDEMKVHILGGTLLP